MNQLTQPVAISVARKKLRTMQAPTPEEAIMSKNWRTQEREQTTTETARYVILAPVILVMTIVGAAVVFWFFKWGELF